MPNLTTHVLDISSGKPAEKIKIELFKLIEGSMQKINEIHTNSDGRSPNPLLNDDNDDNKGVYEVIPRCASDSARGNAFARAAGRASERRRDHRVRAGSREIRVGAGAGFVETPRGDGVLREP